MLNAGSLILVDVYLWKNEKGIRYLMQNFNREERGHSIFRAAAHN